LTVTSLQQQSRDLILQVVSLADNHHSHSLLQPCEGVNLATKDYPDDVDIDVDGEMKHFQDYIKQNI
jgi:hypothetical protein